MTRLPPFVKALIFSASLFASASTYAQSLAGTWDLVESPDGRGPTAGTMTLSPSGAVNFAGNRSTWQPSSTSVQFTVMGAMQVPASEVSMQLVGSTLQGRLVAYKYRMSGGQAVEESRQTFSLSARRPEGFVVPDTSNRQSTPTHSEERSAQQGTRPANEQGVGSAPTKTSSETKVTSGTAPDARGENSSQGSTPGSKEQTAMQDQLEAVAICWENSRNQNKYSCDGPIQNLIIADYTLEQALDLSGCPNPRLTDGSRTVKNRSVIVHLCGYGLISSDRDVVKRNGLTVQRNTYSCPKSQWRCKRQ